MGIENNIEISAPGIQNQQISLQSPQANVIKKPNGTYSIIPKKLGNVDLNVFYGNENQFKKILISNIPPKKEKKNKLKEFLHKK